MANNPKLLLADEPTGEVDEANATKIYQIFKDLNKELNLTTVIVSHDKNLARHVDRVVAIRDGKVSSETVRRFGVEGAANDLAGHAPALTELIVLDSAGRLQIPKDLREQLGIQRYVRLEVLDGGIMIRPVEGEAHQDAKSHFNEMTSAPTQSRWQKWLAKWGRK